MVSETDKAYLAGLLDGEGSIGINNFGGKRVPGLRVTVTNTHLAVLKELQAIWGGALTSRRIRVKGWKASSDLLWGAVTAAEILRAVQPYLRIKQSQCKLALQFQKTVNDSSHRTRKLAEGVAEYRQELRQKMKLLNARGTSLQPERVSE